MSCLRDHQEVMKSGRWGWCLDEIFVKINGERHYLYLRDAAQRWLLTLDTLRERGDIFHAHEEAGCPPVLVYDYEVVKDGAELERPCNYQLLRIVPPDGVTVLDRKRPYIIVDPRAGHGGGIGGFKTDSQVGVALADGHPVYFVNFKRDPEPGQTLADVTRAEAEFVREVQRRHPISPKPVVTGNCQGGWATLLLAATNPDIVGPIVLNGAPVAPWSGEVGNLRRHPQYRRRAYRRGRLRRGGAVLRVPVGVLRHRRPSLAPRHDHAGDGPHPTSVPSTSGAARAAVELEPVVLSS